MATLSKRGVRVNILILLFVLAAVIIFVSYLATHFTGETGVKSDQGLTFCEPDNAPADKQKCYITAHWHAHFDLNICDQKKILPFETGNLQKAHTHVETNKLHWHGLLPVNPKTKQISDYSQLQLKNVFAELKIAISKNGIYEYKNGDKCPDGKTGNLVAAINGQQKQDFLDYEVKDEDKIEIKF